MSIGFVFGLVAIASGLTSVPLIAAVPWIEVTGFLPPPSPPIIENDNVTYIQDGRGHMHKVDVGKVNVAVFIAEPFFSVENDVRFELYTPKNPTKPQILTYNNYNTVKESNFKWWLPTRIFIHGWMSGGTLTPKFTDAYFVRGNHNVNLIVVNWQKGADVFNYLFARRHVEKVAEHVARFIDFMHEKAWMRIIDLTMVGHSLGSHIAGIAGKKITRGKVNRIVGLDPAKPFFIYNDVNDRLAETDAVYVEVIHTSAGRLGFTQPLGTASFYPNGGRSQPGCGLDISGACSHGRAYEFYLESIVTPEFYAFQCVSIENLQQGNCSVVDRHIVQMGGEPGTRKSKGVYYLQTNGESTFSRGKEGLMEAVLAAKKKYSMTKTIKMKSIFTDW